MRHARYKLLFIRNTDQITEVVASSIFYDFLRNFNAMLIASTLVFRFCIPSKNIC